VPDVCRKRHTATVDPWRKLGEHVVFDGHRTILRRRFVLPDGEEVDYDVKVEPDVVAVVAVTPDDRVVLVREYRAGPEELLLELPGGALGPHEHPLDGGRRELREETGYSGDIRYLGGLLDCAYSTRTRHACLATGSRRLAEPTPHAGEHLEVVLIPLDVFVRHVRAGRLTDAAAAYRALDELGLLATSTS
jgi:ADP-ribose pyrophosphatase